MSMNQKDLNDLYLPKPKLLHEKTKPDDIRYYSPLPKKNLINLSENSLLTNINHERNREKSISPDPSAVMLPNRRGLTRIKQQYHNNNEMYKKNQLPASKRDNSFDHGIFILPNVKNMINIEPSSSSIKNESSISSSYITKPINYSPYLLRNLQKDNINMQNQKISKAKTSNMDEWTEDNNISIKEGIESKQDKHNEQKVKFDDEKGDDDDLNTEIRRYLKEKLKQLKKRSAIAFNNEIYIDKTTRNHNKSTISQENTTTLTTLFRECIEEYEQYIKQLEANLHELRKDLSFLKVINKDKEKENQSLKRIIYSYKSKFLLSNEKIPKDYIQVKSMIEETENSKLKSILEDDMMLLQVILNEQKVDNYVLYICKNMKPGKIFRTGSLKVQPQNSTKSVLDIDIVDKFIPFFKQIKPNYTIKTLINVIITETTDLLDIGYIRLLLINHDIKSALEEQIGLIKEFCFIEGQEIQMISKKTYDNIDESVFDKIITRNQLYSLVNIEDEAISIPIPSTSFHNQIWLILQISEPLTTTLNNNTTQKIKKRKRGLGKKEEMIICLFSKIIGILIDLAFQKNSIEKLQRNHKLYIDSISMIQCKNNLQDLLYSIKINLTKYIGFEQLNIVFHCRSKIENFNFFTYNTTKDPDGLYQSTDFIRLETNLGLTNYINDNNIEILYDNNPKVNGKYAAEIDNFSGVLILRNILLGLLKDENNIKIGIIQLLNKADKTNINPQDEEIVKDAIKPLGYIISQCLQVSNTISLAQKLKDSVKNLGNKF